jgi:hypothetical protein
MRRNIAHTPIGAPAQKYLDGAANQFRPIAPPRRAVANQLRTGMRRSVAGAKIPAWAPRCFFDRVAVHWSVFSSKTPGTERLRQRVGTGSALRRRRLQCAEPVLCPPPLAVPNFPLATEYRQSATPFPSSCVLQRVPFGLHLQFWRAWPRRFQKRGLR